MSSDNDNDNDNGIGIAYTTNEEYPHHLNGNDLRSLTTTNPVEYLEFVAAQEQYAPRNLSLHQDSILLQRQQFLPPPQKQYYVVSPDDNLQQTLTSANNNNDYYYNPYFPPTEQQMQQFYNNKHISNPLPLSPLDEVAHNNPYPESYQVEMINDINQPVYQQPLQYQGYQQPYQFQQQFQQQLPLQLPNNNNNDNNNNNNNNNDNDNNNNDNNNNNNNKKKKKKKKNNDNNNHDDHNDESPRSPIDHSAVTPSPLSLPGLYLTRNRSRISTPKIENLPRIPNAYTAQIQQSDSPLRTHFRSNSDSSDSNTSNDNLKKFNILSEIISRDRLSNLKERTAIQDPDESLVKFDFRDANGDPDDPLLNNANVPTQEVGQRQIPTGFDNNINIPHQHLKDDSITTPISPISSTSQVTPIIKKDKTGDKEKNKDHDVIVVGPGKEIKIYKPKQGSIFMLLTIFILAAIVFILWKLGDWGVGDAKNIYNYSANNGVLYIYPPETTKPPPISSNPLNVKI